MSKHLKRGLMITLLACSALTSHSALAQSPPAGQQANPDVDNRRSIVTRPNERVRILSSMRKYLVGLQGVTEALARDDMKAAVEALRSMGSVNLYDVKLSFANQAAIEFRELAQGVHKDFERIAKNAEEKKDPKAMLGQIAAVMKKCTYCHETYRLNDSAN